MKRIEITINKYKTIMVEHTNIKALMLGVIEQLNNTSKFIDLPLTLEWEEDNTYNLYQDGERLGWYSTNPDETDLSNYISDLNNIDPQRMRATLVIE